MADFVWIHNPSTGGVSLQPADAVEQVWSKKGWQLVDLDLGRAAQELGAPALAAHQVPEAYVASLVATRPPDPPPAPAEPKLPRRATKEA